MVELHLFVGPIHGSSVRVILFEAGPETLKAADTSENPAIMGSISNRFFVFTLQKLVGASHASLIPCFCISDSCQDARRSFPERPHPSLIADHF